VATGDTDWGVGLGTLGREPGPAPEDSPFMEHTQATSSEAEPGTLIHLGDYAHERASAAPVFRVLIADGHSLVRAAFRALLEGGGRIAVVGEASTFEQAVASRAGPDPTWRSSTPA
jgi:hypothetical protein